MAGSAARAVERKFFQALLSHEVARGRAEIVALEWSAQINCNGGATELGCPACRFPQRMGHAARCRLGAIIRQVA
ncbi:hypothetical protein WYO_3671 [Methylobacterium sp. GXF4]|uniref:hypothetical protein n=1 Tax=Methylobacterium sp. GXF4 TaxID=1096546 RepID=UPI0002697CE5|nr:hypothetical protein [Methylobacterium sp. GXF4]EIZ83658.1 hypothetical protein WYO_3671 [Methylobacterium sp. GXF4]